MLNEQHKCGVQKKKQQSPDQHGKVLPESLEQLWGETGTCRGLSCCQSSGPSVLWREKRVPFGPQRQGWLLGGTECWKMVRRIFFFLTVLLMITWERRAIYAVGHYFKMVLQLAIHGYQGVFCSGHRGIEECSINSVSLNLTKREVRCCFKRGLRFLQS